MTEITNLVPERDRASRPTIYGCEAVVFAKHPRVEEGQVVGRAFSTKHTVHDTAVGGGEPVVALVQNDRRGDGIDEQLTPHPFRWARRIGYCQRCSSNWIQLEIWKREAQEA